MREGEGTAAPPRLQTVAREWGRIGVTGFGGPPTHIRLLRELCVDRRGWLTEADFDDALSACNLLPGPASTQLSIFCGWRVRGARGALVGGLAFVLPGLALIIGLAALFLSDHAPRWLAGAAAGAGAAVAAVAVHAGLGLAPASWQRAPARARWMGYLIAGTAGAAVAGPWVLLVLIGAGLVELLAQHVRIHPPEGSHSVLAPGLAVTTATGSVGALMWTALKVGALSYGGGFVIVPLMQGDAVDRYSWLSPEQFLTGVALGQVTPGPVVHTIAVVGYGAAGVPGALLTALVAFAPSFLFVLLFAPRFDLLRHNPAVRAFLDGTGPAAIGVILGSAVPLTLALGQWWQGAVLLAALAALLLLRRGVLTVLLAAGAIGVSVALLGGDLPS